MAWSVVLSIEPTGGLSDMDDDDAARQVRSEIIALINSTGYLPLLVRSVQVKSDEEEN